MQLVPLRRQRASDEVYTALRDSILGRMFKPGERLQMNEIAHRLGVSMTPVRQAIQQLATEGLIDIRPRSGTFVATVDTVEVDETCKIRCALECLAGEEAVLRITRAGLDEFHRILEQLAKPVKNEEARRKHERANTQFHNHLIDCSGNIKLREIYTGLNLHLQIARLHARDAKWAERLPQEQKEHEAIVKALEDGDRNALIDALRTHIERARESLISSLLNPPRLTPEPGYRPGRARVGPIEPPADAVTP